MKLWHLERVPGDEGGYDTFDSMVVAAETEEEARLTHPYQDRVWGGRFWMKTGGDEDHYSTWGTPGKLKVREIGTAKEGEAAGVICASFNAG